MYHQYQLYSLHGQSKDALAKTKVGAWEYDIIGPWYKCNMTDIMAAIGLKQFDRYGYDTVWALLPAAAVFICAKDIRLGGKTGNDCLKKALSLLASLSFGVYLVHIFTIAVFTKITHLGSSSLYYRLIGPIIVYIISAVTVYTIKKIPILRYIVP